MSNKIEMVSDEQALVGEGPVWDTSSQTLFWTDILGGRFFNFNPSTKTNKIIHNVVEVILLSTPSAQDMEGRL